MADRTYSIDDFDWSAIGTGGGNVSGLPEEATSPEGAAPSPSPEPAPARRGRSYGLDESKAPPAYLKYEKERFRNRGKRPSAPALSIDDFDWGGVTGAPPASTYNPDDDWAITRGFKTGFEGGADAMGGVADMARIASLPLNERAAEMVKLGQKPVDPAATKLQVEGVQEIGGVGDALTWLGESAGQMGGSWIAAALYGGGAGAATGAAVGGAAGATAAGVGAIPGAIAGGIAGAGYGTLGAFGAMGVGGMFQDLLRDKGVQEGLKNGTVKPDQIYTWSTLGGAAVGALDAFPAAKLTGKITGGKAAAKQLLLQAIKKGAVSQALEEGGTEALQGAISEFGQAAVGGNVDLMERSLSVINQGLAGAVGGAGPGAAGGAIENARAPAYGPQPAVGPQPQGPLMPPIRPRPGQANPAQPAGAGAPSPAANQPTHPVGGNAATGAPPPAGAGGTKTDDSYDKEDEEDKAAFDTGDEGEFTGKAPEGIRRTPVTGDVDIDLTLGAGAVASAAQAAPAPRRRGKAGAAPAPTVVIDHAANAPDLAGALNAAQPQPAKESVQPTVGEPLQGAAPPAVPAETATASMAPAVGGGTSPFEGLGAGIGGIPQMPQQQEQVAEQPAPTGGEELLPIGRRAPVEYPETAWEQPTFDQQLEEAKQQSLQPSEFVEEQQPVEVVAAQEEPLALVEPEPEPEPESKKRPPKATKARLVRVVHFAEEVRQAVHAAQKARQLYDAAEEPVPTEEEVLAKKKGTSYKEKAPVPTPGQAKKRERAAAKFKAEVAAYQKLREAAAATAPAARAALADAVRLYEGLSDEERVHFIDRLGENIGEELLREVAARGARKEPPTSPVEAKPAKPLPRKQPAPKRAPAASAATLKPKPQEEESKAKPKTTKGRLRVTPELTARMRAKHTVDAKAVEAVTAPEFIDYKLSDAKMLPALRATNERLATMADAELRNTSEFKNNRDPAHQIALKHALKEMGVRIPEARPGVTKEAVARERTRKTLLDMLAEAKKQGQAVVVRAAKGFRKLGVVTKVDQDGGVTFGKKSMDIDELFDTRVVDIEDVEQVTELPPVQIRKSVRDRAIEAMREHFDSSSDPVKLKPLGFSAEEIAKLESVGLAVKGTMDADEFQRWQQSLKGAAVPEGVAPTRPAPEPAKPSKYAAHTVAERDKFLTPEELGHKRWQQEQEEKAKAPFKREVKPFKATTIEQVLKSKAKVKPTATVEVTPVAEGYQGPPAPRYEYRQSKGAVPVVAKTAENVVPLKRAIEPKAPRDQGEHFIKEEKKGEARELTADELEDIRDPKRHSATAILEQELQRLLPEALKKAGVSVELSQTQLEEAAAAGARSVGDIYDALKAPLYAALESIDRALKSATAAYQRGEEKAINAFFKNQEALHKARNPMWEAEAKARAEAKAKASHVSPTTGIKASQAIINEDDERTRIIARNERNKAPADQDQDLIKIADLWDIILAPGAKRKENRNNIITLKAGVKRLQAQRIAKAMAREAATEIALARYAETKRQETETMQSHFAEWLVRGIATQEDIEQYQLEQEAAQQFDEKAKRGAQTTPIIHQSLVDHPRPKGREGWDIWSTPRDDAELMVKIQAWAEPWARATRKALRDAGLKVNEKINKKWNTPEENVLIFTENLLGSKWYKTRTKDIHRGQSIVDAWIAVSFIEPKPTEGKSDAEIRHERWQDEQALDGMITDASKTGSAQDDPWGVKANTQMRQESEAARFIRPSDPLGEAAVHRGVGTPMEEAFKRAMNAKGFESQHEFSTDLIKSVDARDKVDSMSAGEAMAKYLAGWSSRPGVKFSGWRRQMRRALIKSLRHLVGDMPVHFVSGDVMIANSPTAREVAGRFVYHPDGKSFILMHEGTKGRRALLDETLTHELIHAATAHAIEHNIRGARDNIRKLMNAMKAQVNVANLTREQGYAFNNEHEFLAVGLQEENVQALMQSLTVPLKVRAQLRAFAHGRANPTFWDTFVSLVQQAVGMFVPGRAGISYMDELLRVYPHVAMSSAEQMRDAEIRVKDSDVEALDLASPFDMGAFFANGKARTERWLNTSGVDWEIKGRKALNIAATTTAQLRRRVTDTVFGGDWDNPYNKVADWLEEKQRSVELKMQAGDRMDDEIRRWMMGKPSERRAHVAELHDIAVNAHLDDVDPSVSLKDNHWIRNDADHPLKGGRKRKQPTFAHERDAGKRAAHARYQARWNALPAELRAMALPRLKHMKAMMQEYETDMVTGFLDRLLDAKDSKYILPPGMLRVDAVKEIMADKMSPELKAALGNHAKTLGAMGKFGVRDGMYAPATRMGRHFISGRRNIATPTASRGTVLFDQDAMDNQRIFRFVFDNLQDAVDYHSKMGASGDERVRSFQRKYIDPRDGTFVESVWTVFENGVQYEAQPVYYVTMQDRFMAMSDSPGQLKQLRQELIDSGEYEEANISQSMLMEEHRNATNTMPLQLQAMINNINGQSDIDADDKALAIQMLTNHFIKTQQGNRITKRMLKATGVRGFETGADEMFRAFHSNNEMMARHIVGQQRAPGLDKAKQELKAFEDALRFGRRPEDLIKLPQKQRDLLTRGYGRSQDMMSERLGEDIRELNHRIKSMSMPDKLRGNNLLNAIQSITTLNYLGKPIYMALQSLSLPMFTIPNMSAEMSRLDGLSGVTRAWRYLSKGMADVGVAKTIWRGFAEAGAEAKQLAGGLKPREGFMHEGRVMRRAYDYIEDLENALRANNAKYLAVKIEGLRRAYMRQAIGQAGLDQPNLRMDLQGGTTAFSRGKNKFFRGIEESTRIFRAMQEGIETVNRAAPLFGYIEYYMDKGFNENDAIELAINNMVKEQVNYAKTNWAAWMGNPWASTALMFKKFAWQQGYSYWQSLTKVIDPRDKVAQRAAAIHLGTTAVILGALGGAAGNPLWEPIRYLMYLLGMLGFGVPETWDEAKTSGEKWMADATNPMLAETVMYGLPRLMGFDLANRVAMDSILFYQQPEEMTREAWYTILGQATVGASGSMLFDAASNIKGMTSGDSTWPKWLSQLPAPGMVKDILKAYDNMENGPTTTTGVKTGEPTGVLGALVQTLGIKTRAQARPFEQGSAAQNRAQERVNTQKSALIRSINAGGLTGANMRRINEWNRAHPKKTDRISGSSLSEARKRRTKMEREIATQNLGAL